MFNWKDNGKTKLLIICGTRPEIIRLAAVMKKSREYLLKNGILTRSCGDMPPLTDDYIRLAVRPEAEQKLLLELLAMSRDRISGV